MGDYSNDGFYTGGGYDQQQYGGYGGGDQQMYGDGGGSGSYNPGNYNQGYMQQGYTSPSPSIMTPNNFGSSNSQSAGGVSQGNYATFEDEPPLLEELGINFEHISLTTKSVLNPFQQTDSNVIDDADLAGPLVFCLAFGGFLLLSGKVHGFGYIYGVGVMGCLCMYSVLNLMSMTGVTLQCVISILGYCLLPMVILSGVSVVFILTGTLGTILTGLVIIWCSLSASKLFVTLLAMDQQQALVMYPCALLYGVFALLTVF